ncbi:MAG: hypothetical protein LAQ69_38195 [Acidobacteriia bacterium]|nr:hypothetical protein [Terriglobia bacterium]
MDDAADAGHDIALSAISLAESVYLIEKNRLPVSAYDDLKIALSDPDYVIEEAPFTGEVVEAMRQVPRAEVPDMPDRIVAATAAHFWGSGHQPRWPYSRLETAKRSGSEGGGCGPHTNIGRFGNARAFQQANQ